MQNFIQPGDSVTLIAPTGGVVSGGVYVIGQLLVVATHSAAQATSFTGKTKGVFSVPKIGSQSWAEGALVYYDEANARFTTTAANHFRAGVAVEAVGSGAEETTGKVRLDGVGRTQAGGSVSASPSQSPSASASPSA